MTVIGTLPCEIEGIVEKRTAIVADVFGMQPGSAPPAGLCVRLWRRRPRPGASVQLEPKGIAPQRRRLEGTTVKRTTDVADMVYAEPQSAPLAGPRGHLGHRWPRQSAGAPAELKGIGVRKLDDMSQIAPSIIRALLCATLSRGRSVRRCSTRQARCWGMQ